MNYNPNQEPFYLHPPSLSAKIVPNKMKNTICNSQHNKAINTNGKLINGNEKTDTHSKCNGFYVNPITTVISSDDQKNANDPFYLHNPREVIYTRVQDVFHLNEDRGRRISNDSSISSGSSTIAAKSNSSVNGLTGKYFIILHLY